VKTAECIHSTHNPLRDAIDIPSGTTGTKKERKGASKFKSRTTIHRACKWSELTMDEE
jgi:hypothetical protein